MADQNKKRGFRQGNLKEIWLYESYFFKELLSPYTYFLQVRGKKGREKIIRSFNNWLQLPSDRLDQLLDIFNSICVSCLLFDDIQDDAKVRELMPAAHCVYGIPLTMNASMYALLMALQRASNLNPKVGDVIIENYLAVMRGQGTILAR